MLKKLSLLCGFLLFVPDWAMAQSDEIIVTASRRDHGSTYKQPHIVMKRRPDNVILSVNVVCDTRNASERLKELRATMESVVKTARAMPEIDLGILIEREDDQGEEITFVRPYDHEKFGDYVTSGYRADTNAVNLVLKTKVTPQFETGDDALEILEAFIDGVRTTGRTEVVTSGDPVMSIISPEQYRYEIINEIASDATRVAHAFGADYHVQVDGLEAPIIFYQTGDMELTLYIPYGFDILKSK